MRSLVVAALLFVLLPVRLAHADAQCGNGSVEPDEECDDGGVCIGGADAGTPCISETACHGNGVCTGGVKLGTACAADVDCPDSRCVRCKPFGGDGCAANCTLESDVPFPLAPGVLQASALAGGSGVIVYSDVLNIPLPMMGSLHLTIGEERDGEVPVVVKAASVDLAAIRIAALGLACVRGIVAKTCGGSFLEADGVTLSPDCTFDANVCVDKNPCTLLHGEGNIATGTIGCSGGVPDHLAVKQDAGGSTMQPGTALIDLSGSGGPGSALILGSTALGTRVGLCGAPDDLCGADGEFCTDDDPASVRGTPTTQLFVTGTATGAVFNANGVDGARVGTVSVTGMPFSCGDLTRGNAVGTCLVSASTVLDQPTVGDIVTTAALCVQPGPPPTSTPTRLPTPRPTPTPTPLGLSVEVASVRGNPGEQVTVAVTLHTAGAAVAGVQNDISFSPRSVSLVGCAVNPSINKDFTQFKYSVAGLRAVVLGNNVDAIPDGAVLYTCTFTIVPDAPPGSSILFNTRIVASSPSGQALPVGRIDGAVFVLGGPPTRPPTSTLTPSPTATPLRPAIILSNPMGVPGETVMVAATLRAAGATIAGTQNDITFDRTGVAIAAKPSGAPDCSLNPAIDKRGTAFAFLPPGCSSAACTGVRAVVFAVDNLDPIPDGSVLYTCKVGIAASANRYSYELTLSNWSLSDPTGNAVPFASGVSGTVYVALPTPTEVPPGPAVNLSTANADAGDQVIISATLSAHGHLITGVQNDIVFDPFAVAVAARADGKPDCAVSPAIDKAATAFSFLPSGCSGTACTVLRALVFALDNTDPVADGALLYTCKVNVAAGAAPGVYRLRVVSVGFSDPTGGAFGAGVSRDGVVFVGGVVDGPPSPATTATSGSATMTPTPQQAPTPTPTDHPPRTFTPSTTATATARRGNGGCQIDTRRRGRGGLLLLIPAFSLLALRRRSDSTLSFPSNRD